MQSLSAHAHAWLLPSRQNQCQYLKLGEHAKEGV